MEVHLSDIPTLSPCQLRLKLGGGALARLRELFSSHGTLTRAEVIVILEVSPTTATRYLKLLCREGWIDKVEPTRSPRTHYFQLADRE